MDVSKETILLDEIFEIYEFAMDVVNDSSQVLFRISRRETFHADWKQLKKQIPDLKKYARDGIENLYSAGLRGQALLHKVEWLRESRDLFFKMGSVPYLKQLLSKLNIVLKSLVGAIPPIGSGIVELKELGEKEIEDTEQHIPRS